MEALKLEDVAIRTDSLETILGEFIVQTGNALKELKRSQMTLHKEMGEFKDEMRAFKDEMGEFKDEMKEFKRTSEQQAKDLNKKWGELANRLGTFAEDIVAPNVPYIAEKYFGLKDCVDFVTRSVRKMPESRTFVREFDAMAVYADWVILNETKATVRMNYVEDFIQFVKEEKFYDYYPEYRGKKLIPVFSAMSIPVNIVEYLSRNNIFAMAMSEGTMDLLNYDAVSSVYTFPEINN